MILVGIPSIGKSEHLADLIRSCHEGGADLRIECNGTAEDAAALRAIVNPVGIPVAYRRHAGGIYRSWNYVLEAAEAAGADAAVILNDDIAIHPSSLAVAVEVLRDPGVGIVGWDPDTTELHPVTYDSIRLEEAHGSYREHGVPGYAFAVHPLTGLRCDEEYGWWGGDDDLIYTARKEGYRPVVMRGAGVLHWPSTSSSQRPEVLDSIGEDRKRLMWKWGRAW